MKNTSFTILAVLVISSCSFMKWPDSVKGERTLASAAQNTLIYEDADSFGAELDDKLKSLHDYYVIGQKNLHAFDKGLASGSIKDIYQSSAYLNLLAVRSQVEAIEHDIHDAWERNKTLKDFHSQAKNDLIKERIKQFASKSSLKSSSMENILYRLEGQSQKTYTKSFSFDEVQTEHQNLEADKSFRVNEKNVEHLSHTLENKIFSENKRFEPSTSKSGNITGNEFPAKVWSLTYDDGPGKASTMTILAALQKRDLKATFFQLAQKAQENKVEALKLSAAGMEIASHSWSHQQLTKVGAVALKKEISDATAAISKVHNGTKIRFFRLPYGAGVNSPNIRELIKKNGLIHVFWNIDTLDWMAQDPQKIVDRTKAMMKKTARDAGVILFHDIHDRTAKASPAIMDYLKQDGRRVCTLATIVDQMNNGAEVVCPKN